LSAWESKAKKGFEAGLNEQIDAVVNQLRKYE
jgi:hypothetical protein